MPAIRVISIQQNNSNNLLASATCDVQLDVYHSERESMGPVNFYKVPVSGPEMRQFLNELEDMEVTAVHSEGAGHRIKVSNGKAFVEFDTNDLPSKGMCDHILHNVHALHEARKPAPK